MRKKEREIADRAQVDAILSAAKIVRVAFAVENEPYVVPLSYGYDPKAGILYVHTAREGRKIDCIEANPRICFEVEGTSRMKAGDERGCSWGVLYESVIGYGTIRELIDPEAREAALLWIMRQQSGRDGKWTFSPEVVAVTRVWAITVESVTGKRSGPPTG